MLKCLNELVLNVAVEIMDPPENPNFNMMLIQEKLVVDVHNFVNWVTFQGMILIKVKKNTF
jgi:hypothetical protein